MPSLTNAMESDQRKKIGELNKLASTIIQDPLYSNQIHRFIDILVNLDLSESNELYIETVIRCLAKIFNFYIDSREFVLSKKTDSESESINSYKSHLIQWFDLVQEELLKIVRNEDEIKFSENIQKLALTTLIKFLEEEGNYQFYRGCIMVIDAILFTGKFPFRSVQNVDEYSFPSQLLSKIIKALISESTYNQELISVYTLYYQYDDFIHFTLQALIEVIDSYKRTNNSSVMQNIIDFIFPIRLITPTDLLPKSLQAEIKLKKRKRSKGVTGEQNYWMRLCD